MDCYGPPPPRLDPSDLQGRLIVIEGPDAVGRSTQIGLLTRWLEAQGQAVAHIGLSRSTLAGPELEAAKQGHQLRPATMALFYAADLFDQIENRMVPALRAGFVVLADRYVHSLIARSLVRDLEEDWLASLYRGALKPHAVFYLRASPKRLVERMLHKHGSLDFWEAGMDLGLSGDWYESFLLYQKRARRAMDQVGHRFPMTVVNANRTVQTIQSDLRAQIGPLLAPERAGAAPRSL